MQLVQKRVYAYNLFASAAVITKMQYIFTFQVSMFCFLACKSVTYYDI